MQNCQNNIIAEQFVVAFALFLSSSGVVIPEGPVSKTKLGSLGPLRLHTTGHPLETVWNMPCSDLTASRGCKKAGVSFHQLLLSLIEGHFWKVNSQKH